MKEYTHLPHESFNNMDIYISKSIFNMETVNSVVIEIENMRIPFIGTLTTAREFVDNIRNIHLPEMITKRNNKLHLLKYYPCQEAHANLYLVVRSVIDLSKCTESEINLIESEAPYNLPYGVDTIYLDHFNANYN